MSYTCKITCGSEVIDEQKFDTREEANEWEGANDSEIVLLVPRFWKTPAGISSTPMNMTTKSSDNSRGRFASLVDLSPIEQQIAHVDNAVYTTIATINSFHWPD